MPFVHHGDEVEPRTVFVSDLLQGRLDAHCEDTGRSATDVTFAAIEQAGPDLGAIVRASRVPLVAPATGERQLGVGPVRVVLRPGAAGARVLDRLSDELQVPWRIWIPALLNARLPGRREPDDMPWLERARARPDPGRGHDTPVGDLDQR